MRATKVTKREAGSQERRVVFVGGRILDFESLRSGAQLPYQRVSSLPYVT